MVGNISNAGEANMSLGGEIDNFRRRVYLRERVSNTCQLC